MEPELVTVDVYIFFLLILPSVCLDAAVVVVHGVADIEQCEGDHEYQPRCSAIREISFGKEGRKDSF